MEELQRQQQGLHDPECTSIDEPITKGCSKLEVYMYLDDNFDRTFIWLNTKPSK